MHWVSSGIGCARRSYRLVYTVFGSFYISINVDERQCGAPVLSSSPLTTRDRVALDETKNPNPLRRTTTRFSDAPDSAPRAPLRGSRHFFRFAKTRVPSNWPPRNGRRASRGSPEAPGQRDRGNKKRFSFPTVNRCTAIVTRRVVCPTCFRVPNTEVAF